jgi:hypothetical protein
VGEKGGERGKGESFYKRTPMMKSSFLAFLGVCLGIL